MRTDIHRVSLAVALGLTVALATGGCAAAHAGPATPAAAMAACTTAVGSVRSLTGQTATLPGIQDPFGIAAAPGGRYAFAATDEPAQLLVLSTGGLRPRLVRTIALSGGPEGATLSPDGTYLLVADDTGAVVISVAEAERGRGSPILGWLTSTGTGATQVAFSGAGSFAIVTMEDSAQAAVFNLGQALASDFAKAGPVGYIPLGGGPIGMALSPDGQYLYVTSQAKTATSTQGTLSVVRVSTAETDPARSVVNTVAAGCDPVRVITSANGQDVWVSDRGSDALGVFSAAALRHGTEAHAVRGWTRVGEAPVDMAFVRNGALIVVADSNRFYARGRASSLGVVNVADVLTGKPGLTGTLSSGAFPRELAVEAGGKVLLVTNYYAAQIEAVSVAGLP